MADPNRCTHANAAHGLCPDCGHCEHDVVLNAVCFYCGETNLPVRIEPSAAGREVVPIDRLRRKRPEDDSGGD